MAGMPQERAVVIVRSSPEWHRLAPLTNNPELTKWLKHAGASRYSRPTPMRSMDSLTRPVFGVDVPGGTADDVAQELRNAGGVDSAFVVRPAPMRLQSDVAMASRHDGGNFGAAGRDYWEMQWPMFAAVGCDVYDLWQLPGGLGRNVNVIDIEYEWNLLHEDIAPSVMELPGSLPCVNPPADAAEHGTAVIGLLAGIHNETGIYGVAPEASTRVLSHCGPGYISDAIAAASAVLEPGDILLIEAQNHGPVGEYLPVEWWPDAWTAIRAATDKGIIVVECAGNGGVDLDNPLYDSPLQGFWPEWVNPFRRSGAWDSGALLVGAGAPPPEYCGDYGPDASRMYMSNYGNCVDLHAWGAGVITAGYGDLSNAHPNAKYTNTFAGTSSAGALVAGMLASVQGVLKAEGLPPMRPEEVRQLVRSGIGTPQTNTADYPVTQRIGPRVGGRTIYEALRANR